MSIWASVATIFKWPLAQFRLEKTDSSESLLRARIGLSGAERSGNVPIKASVYWVPTPGFFVTAIVFDTVNAVWVNDGLMVAVPYTSARIQTSYQANANVR